MVEIDTKSVFEPRTLGGVALIGVGVIVLRNAYNRFKISEYWRAIGMGVVGAGAVYFGIQIFQGKAESAKKEVREELKERVSDVIEGKEETESKEAQHECACGPDCKCAETYEAEFTESQRKKLAKKGFALPDGSFPIRNRNDLENAIKSWGLAKNKSLAKKFIKKRAKQLGAMKELPANW